MVSAPLTLQDALEFRRQHPHCTIVAGATDQYVRLRSKEGVVPMLGEHVLYLSGIQELSKIESKETVHDIGATATLAQILRHEELPPLLQEAIRQIGGPGIRNVATLAGNIANASPAADGVVALIALSAQLVLRTTTEKRIVRVEDFITGVRKTMLKPDELITNILVSKESYTHSVFQKVGGRKADAISKVSFCGLAVVNQGILYDLRIAFGAVGPKVVADGLFDATFHNRPLQELDINAILNHYADKISPIDDQRSDKHYRHDVAMNLLKRFLGTLMEDAHA